MRDIFEDLTERLELAESRFLEIRERHDHDRHRIEAAFQCELAAFEKERSALASLLEIEAARKGLPVRRIEKPKPAYRLPLPDFFVTAIHKRGKATKDDLRDAAEDQGYFDNGESGGRQTHTTLMNLVNAGKLLRLDDGSYSLPTQATSLFGMGRSKEAEMKPIN